MSTTTPTRTVTLTANDPGAAVSKFLICLQKANGNEHMAMEIAAERCRRLPIVEHSLKELTTKAAVGAGNTSTVGWATETAPYGIAAEAYLLLQSASILGRLSPLFRRVPWRVKAPKETGAGGSGAWRGEGLPSVVAKTTFDTFQTEYRAASVIVAATKELFKFGAVSEAALRAMVLAAVAKYVDGQLLDPAVTASTARPASLTNGAQPVTQTGVTAAAMSADLASLLALIQTAADGLVWVMRPLTYYAIAAKFAGAGMPLTPGYLLTIPVILSSTSPRQITLIDPANVAFSSDDTLELDLSTEGSIQMDSAPTQTGIVGTGSAMVSLYQTNMVGVRANLAASWQTIRYGTGSPTVSAGCSYMVTTY